MMYSGSNFWQPENSESAAALLLLHSVDSFPAIPANFLSSVLTSLPGWGTDLHAHPLRRCRPLMVPPLTDAFLPPSTGCPEIKVDTALLIPRIRDRYVGMLFRPKSDLWMSAPGIRPSAARQRTVLRCEAPKIQQAKPVFRMTFEIPAAVSTEELKRFPSCFLLRSKKK